MNKNFRVLLFYGNAFLHGAAPTNLAILSAYLKADEFDVKLFDCTIYKQNSQESMDEVRAKLGHVKKTSLEDYVNVKKVDIYLSNSIRQIY